MRIANPIFKYDFKVGNYMPDDAKKMNPHLFATIKDITTGIRKSAWFASEDYSRLFRGNVVSHLLYFGDHNTLGLNRQALAGMSSDMDSTFVLNSYHSTNATFSGGFYNFFLSLGASSGALNSR